MLRIAICCGGGFSSSTMAANLEKQVQAKGLQDEVSFQFIPFSGLWGGSDAFFSGKINERQDEVDVALLCPHLEYQLRQNLDKLRIPCFVLPMKLYGALPVDHLIEEAEDVLELWNGGMKNPILFPDEPRSMTAPRTMSHRRWVAAQQ